VVNYLVYDYSQRWDLTEDQQNTLSQETIDTLDTLPEEVTVQAYYTPRINSESARALLDQYAFESDGKFAYSFIDPEADPIAAQNANVTRDGTVVLGMGGRQEQVTLVNEEELTSALVRLMNTDAYGIYFLTGHGERNVEQAGEDTYSQLRSTLENKNYMVGSLNLLANNPIPEDAKVIIIAGPQKPVSDAEVSQLDSFIQNGGSLIVLEEPIPVTEFGDSPDPIRAYLQDNWGISLGLDMVVDLTSQQPFVAWANAYADHAIANRMQGMVSFFPTARSVRSSGDFSDVNAVELVFTADQAWAETDLTGLVNNEEISPDDGVDLVGQVPLAIAAENTSQNQRIVVFGDSDFAVDANFSAYGNGDLLVNAIDWAAEQEELISLTPKDVTQRVLIPPQRYTMNMLFFGSVILLPGVFLVAGVIVFIRRRRRG
jgi:ABC-type uncharacterized transport system involved in gliding motility auxiliary subunit